MRHSFDNDAMLVDVDDDKYNGEEEGTLSHRKLVHPQEESKNDHITPLNYVT